MVEKMPAEMSGDGAEVRAFGAATMSGRALICWLGVQRLRTLLTFFIVGNGSLGRA